MMEAAQRLEHFGEALVSLALDECTAPQPFYRAAFLNFLGAMRSGSHDPGVEAFVLSRAALAPGTHVPVGRGDGLTLPDYVMATCFASSVQAFDDIHFATTTHPSGPVVSALLGVAELTDVSMVDAAEALALGMEVECRLALTLFSAGTGSASGWYTTGIAGGVGAAAAAGRLLGLGPKAMASALGWAAAMASGVRGTHGSAAGTFVPALAARAGLEAALLARDGLSCGLGALTGPNGLVRQVAPEPALGEASVGLGTDWVSLQTSVKPYPFGFVAFAAVDAACALDLGGGSKRLDVFVSPRAEQLGGNARPSDANEAIVSIPFLVARTLADPRSVQVPVPPKFSVAPEVKDLMDRIELHADPSLSDGAARIVVDGGARSASCDAARGTAGHELTVGETIDKFRAICGLEDPEPVLDAVMGGAASLGHVIALMR